MQSKKNLIELINNKQIEITSTTNDYPFNIGEQVGSDSIDLRIGEYFYKLDEDIEYINTLNISSATANQMFIKHDLNINGYILQPNEVIFVPTLEKINMKSPRHYGFLCGRSYYARLGISIHCTMPKFGYGMNSIASLQIKNNTAVPLKIFPRQKMLQLIINEIYGEMVPYKGTYSSETEYILPFSKESEFNSYKDREIKVLKEDELRRITKKKVTKTTLDKLENYFKIKNIVSGLLGMGGIVGFAIAYLQEKDTSYLFLLFYALIIGVDFIYSELTLSKGVKIDEKDF